MASKKNVQLKTILRKRIGSKCRKVLNRNMGRQRELNALVGTDHFFEVLGL